VLTNTDPTSAEGTFVMTATTLWKTSHCGTVQPAHGLHRKFWSYG